MKLSLFTITRNTAKRLEEWVIYHSKVGIDEFLIYLDNPTDNSEYILKELSKEYNIIYEVLEPNGKYFDGRYGEEYENWFKEQGTPLFNAPHLIRQFQAVNRAIDFFKDKYMEINHWTAFQDVDEFLVPQKEKNIKEIILKYNQFYDRVIALDYRFKVPHDRSSSFIKQSTLRRPVSSMVNHWPTRKSIVRTKYCGKVKCLHDMDRSPYLMIDDELKLYHFRDSPSFPKETYFIEDTRALELLSGQ